MIVALIAAAAMFVQDIIGVALTQAEARNRVWLTGGLDSLVWGVGIFTTTLSVTALQGHDLGLKVAVIAAVSVANVLGGASGVAIGRKLIKEDDEPPSTPPLRHS